MKVQTKKGSPVDKSGNRASGKGDARFVRTVKNLLSSPPNKRVKSEKAPAPTDASSSR